MAPFPCLPAAFELLSKALTLENAQIYLAFCSLIRTFAGDYNTKLRD